MQSPIRHPHLPCLLAASLLLATAFPASAQISKTESGCRGAISKATAKYMKAFGKAVVGCHVARDGDASMSATN